MLTAANLNQELLELTESRILDRPSKKKYSFNNKLVWEVVYDAVRFSEKRRLHNLVGLYIESLNRENLDNESNLLLHHFESAQNHQKTIYYGAIAGDRAARMFAAEEAIHSYKRALNALEQLSTDKLIDRSLVLEKFGDVYLKSGEYPKAIEKYLAAFNTWNEAPIDQEPEYVPWEITRNSLSSNLCRKISVSYEYTSNYEKAFSWINKAIDFLPEDSGKIVPRVYAAKSAIYFRKGEYEDAVEWGEKALAFSQKSKDSRDFAYSHNMIANSFIHMGKLRDAIKHLQQAVIRYDDEQDFVGMGAAHSNLASCYMFMDNLKYAEEHFRIAMEAKEKVQNDAQLAIEYNNLGELYLMQGRLDESKNLFDKVIVAHKNGYAPDALAGYALMNTSRYYLFKGNVDKAGNIIESALDLIRDSGLKTIYLETQLQQAIILLAQEQLEEALDLCSKIKDEIKSQGVNLLAAKTDRILAKIQYRQGEISESIETIKDSINLANSIGSRFEEGKSLNEYAKMLIEHGVDVEIAKKSLKRAENIFSDMGATRELAYTQHLSNQMNKPQEQE